MSEKKSNHRVNVVRIAEVLPHNNADSLEIIQVGGYQAVVKKGAFKAGDLGVYIQPDSVVPQTEPFRFIWEGSIQVDGTVPERKRRITVRKFRKEWSEGLLLPVTDFLDPYNLKLNPFGRSSCYARGWKEGDDVSALLDITHYEAPEPVESTSVQRKQQYKWPPKSFKGWMYYLLNLIGIDLNKGVGGRNSGGPKDPPPIYDVEALKNYKDAFQPDEQVIVTEKIHGSNARFLFKKGKFYVGSRTLWKSESSNCVWRKAVAQNPWIETWCREHEGFTLYGEVVPTQSGFTYGSAEGQVRFFVFDIRTPDEEWLAYEDTYMADASTTDLQWVPLLYRGPFIGIDFALTEGRSLVIGATHIREGIVIKPVVERHVRGLGRLQLKLVSNTFLEKDSK